VTRLIERALKLRENYQWCLKTDIKSFFDKIARPRLKKQITKALRGTSLEALVLKVVDCEAKSTSKNREKLRRQGLTPSLGIRQGMPLSPLLANLALADFDKEIEGRKIEMVRYADDLVLFFRNKEDAKDAHKYLELLLATFKLSIPELQTVRKQNLYRDLILLNFWARNRIPW
jgi:RNA-directed DNA polymerase